MLGSAWSGSSTSSASELYGASPERRRPVRHNRVVERVRIDKWLWAARFFKTRSLAGKACELGRIQSHGQPLKAAREVRVGEMLRITNDGGDFEVEVLALSDVRGAASVAQTLYRETDESRELRGETFHCFGE